METPEVIYEFLNILNDNLKSKTKQDFNEMQKMKNIESPINQVYKIYQILFIIFLF